MNEILARWNALPLEDAAGEILPCCGSQGWAREMALRRPVRDEAALLAASDDVWKNLRESDWMQAFRAHPRIGESDGPATNPQRSAVWSRTEQEMVRAADEEVKLALAQANRAYEKRFNRIFIVCATGKSGQEILEMVRRRLQNDDTAELHETAEQQRQIARIRLRKWLTP